MEIIKTDKEKHEKFLRNKTTEINFDEEEKKYLRNLIKDMRKTMIEAEGVGLSANQVHLDKRIFVAQVPDKNNKPKFYAIINPEITKKSDETITVNEGCLSIPGKYGPVERPKQVTLEGYNIEGKKIKIKAWGILARVFQHEVDHLNGKLFIDKAIEIFEEEKENSEDSEKKT